MSVLARNLNAFIFLLYMLFPRFSAVRFSLDVSAMLPSLSTAAPLSATRASFRMLREVLEHTLKEPVGTVTFKEALTGRTLFYQLSVFRTLE